MKKAEFFITSGSDVQIDQDSCTPADWFLNRIVRQSSVRSKPAFWSASYSMLTYSSSMVPWNRIRRSVQGTINMKDEDGFKPARESTHLSLPTRYELANGFTSIPSRLLGDLEEKHLPQTFSIATRVAHDGIRIVVTSVRITLSNLKVQHLKDLLESRYSCSGVST